MESGSSLYYVISEQRKCYLHIVGFGKNFLFLRHLVHGVDREVQEQVFQP